MAADRLICADPQPIETEMTTADPLSHVFDRDRLVAIIRDRSYREGEFTLASGKTSRFYINMKPTMMHADGAALIALGVLDALAAFDASHVGGLEMGAVPIAASVAATSRLTGRPVATFFVRKEAKGHGTRALIEGLAEGETLSGQRVVVLEDVTTTGGSALKAVETLRAEGADVVCVITIVDRKEGAAETFAEAGLTFVPILTIDDLRSDA